MLKQMTKLDYLQDFIAWVGEQPADRTYHFTNSQTCAVGLYMQERLGIKAGTVEYAAAWAIGMHDGQVHPVVKVTHEDNAAVYFALTYAWAIGPSTFGELAKRLNKIELPVTA